jgi:hypothetical protein
MQHDYDKDYDDESSDECDHEDHESDIISGRASCCMCGHSWYLSNEELDAEQSRRAKYDEYQSDQERRERWDRITWPFRWAWYRILNRIAPRTAVRALRDDEIPF